MSGSELRYLKPLTPEQALTLRLVTERYEGRGAAFLLFEDEDSVCLKIPDHIKRKADAQTETFGAVQLTEGVSSAGN